MDPALLSAYVTLGSSAVSSGGGLIGGILANRANAKENQKNREWNEKMWHMTNEYNLPINAYQRDIEGLAANGLNPNLAYGNLGQSLASYAGNLGTQKAYENPAKDFKLDVGEAFRLKNETEVAKSTVNVNETQANKNTEDANLAKEQAEKTGWENIITSQTYENTIQSSLENLEILKNNKLISEEQYKIKQEELKEQIEVVRRAKAAADVEEEQVNTQKAETLVKETLAKLNTKQAEYYEAEKAVAASAAKLNAAQAAYYNELKKNQPYVRKELQANAAASIGKLQESLSAAGLNKAMSKKVAEETIQMVLNGQVDRAAKFLDMSLKNTSQRYGTGMIGSSLGILLDALPQAKKVKHSFNSSTRGVTSEW